MDSATIRFFLSLSFLDVSLSTFIDPSFSQSAWSQRCGATRCNPCQMCIPTFTVCSLQWCPHVCAERLCADQQAVCTVVYNKPQCRRKTSNQWISTSLGVAPDGNHGSLPPGPGNVGFRLAQPGPNNPDNFAGGALPENFGPVTTGSFGPLPDNFGPGSGGFRENFGPGNGQGFFGPDPFGLGGNPFGPGGRGFGPNPGGFPWGPGINPWKPKIEEFPEWKKGSGKFSTKLIPRSAMFTAPTRRGVKISPDGKYLGFIAPLHRIPNIWIQNIDDAVNGIDSETPITYDRGPGIRSFQWTHVPGLVMYLEDMNGDENHRLYRVNAFTRQRTQLAGSAGHKVKILSGHKDFPQKWFIGINDRDKRHFDVYSLNIVTGEKELYFENTEGFASFHFDQAMKLRLVAKPAPEGGTVYYIPRMTGPKSHQITWEFYRHVPFDDELTTKPSMFDPANIHLYWHDSTKSDKSGITITNFKTQQVVQTVYAPTKSDAGPVLWNSDEHSPIAVIEDYGKPSWIVLDEQFQDDMDFLANFDKDAFPMVAGGSSDFKLWLVMMTFDNKAPTYYLYDRNQAKKELKFLFDVNKAINKYKLAKMHSVEVETRDGLTQVCFLTIPYDLDPNDTGRPSSPGPFLLKVHGGPWARDRWGFDPSTQLWANRGYSVMQCNFRSSTGYGKKFINLGNGEWGGKMHEDLLDAVDWALREGVADRKKVAIYGGSYGGYAVLAGLAFSPEVFACGVDIVGPSNLVTLLKAVPPTWRPFYESMKKRIGGDPETEEGRRKLRSQSPLFFAEKISKPLFIAQGANDPRVLRSESDQIVKALRENGTPVTYIVFPDEGHGFQKINNRLAHVTIAEDFLSKCLGGRAEPKGRDSYGTSMQILSRGE